MLNVGVSGLRANSPPPLPRRGLRFRLPLERHRPVLEQHLLPPGQSWECSLSTSEATIRDKGELLGGKQNLSGKSTFLLHTCDQERPVVVRRIPHCESTNFRKNSGEHLTRIAVKLVNGFIETR